MNYNDYQLEEMENEAVNKSNNLKKAAVIGGAAVVGGGAAVAATQFGGNENEALTNDDLLAGAEAGELTEDTVEAPQQVVVEEHVEVKPAPAPVEEPEPELIVEDTSVVIDEYGNYVGAVDEGTYDGKAFAVVDSDGNGAGDLLAYDENGNGIYEQHEIVELDNHGYIMGQGNTAHVYVQDDWGNLHEVGEDGSIQGYALVDGQDEIHNDFDDEPRGDWAYHNDDYNNNEDHAYSAGMHPDEIDIDEKYDGGDIVEEELAYDAEGSESFDTTDDFTADNDIDTFDDGSAYMA